MAWCARDTYRMKMISLSDHRILRTCMTDLGWFQMKQNKLSRIHGGNLHQMHVNQRKSLLSSKRILHERGMKEMLTQVSNTSWMFNTNHGGDKMLLMGSITTHRNFHITGLPPSCEHGDSIGQTKRYNGICSRDQPWVRQHYEHRWFWFDLMIAHTQFKVW